jgi:hypothetical protein
MRRIIKNSVILVTVCAVGYFIGYAVYTFSRVF